MHFGSLMFTRSKINSDMGDASQAEADMFVARRVYEENIERGAGDYAVLRLATVLKEVGSGFAKKDRFQEALVKYKESFSMFKKIYPNELYRGISATLNDLANICITFRKFDLAKEYIDRSMMINSKLFGEGSLELSTNYHTLGNYHLKKQE